MPALLVVVLNVIPVSIRVATTPTSGTTAPCGSETMPLRTPLSVCAQAELMNSVRMKTERTAHTRQRWGILPPMANVRMAGPCLYQSVFESAAILKELAKRLLGMVGWRPEVRIKNGLTTWRSEWPSLRLQGHEDGIDLLQNLGILELHDPPMLALIIGIEDPQAQWLLFTQLVAVATPGCVYKSAIRDLIRRQIVGVEDKRFALSIEGSAKSFLHAALTIGIHYVDHVKIASRHDVANLSVGGEHLPLPIHTT